MGIFKISNKSCEPNLYISYSIVDNAVTLYVLDLKEISYVLKVNCDSVTVKKWAQNLKQKPEEYIKQLSDALREQQHDSLKSKPSGNNKDDCKTSGQNIFEIEETFLIWKQFFEAKKIFGRKGKFPLEEISKNEILEIILNTLITELHEKESLMSLLNTENETLCKEKNELSRIAEESVTMKEKFEREIYGKFSSLLNAKKHKNTELRAQLRKSNVKVTSSIAASSSNSGHRDEGNQSDGEYDADTDVDSPDEVEVIEEGSPSTSKKRKESEQDPYNDNKKSKSKGSINRDSQNESSGSQDLLDASMEAELNLGLSSHKFRKKY